MAAVQQTDVPVHIPPIVKLLLDPHGKETVVLEVPFFELNDDEDGEGREAASPQPRDQSEFSIPFSPVDALVHLVWSRTVKDLDCSSLDTECPIVAINAPTDVWADLVAKLLGRSNTGISIVRLEKPKDLEKLRTEHLPVMRPLIIVTQDATMIPDNVKAGIDATITVAPLSVEIVADLIHDASKRRVTPMQRERLSSILHFDPYEIAAIVRRGRSRDKILAAIDMASTRSNDSVVPDFAVTRAFGEAGVWGRQLAEDLKAWRHGEITWTEVDRGCLLWGPPGTGKTMFAKSLAAFCGVPLVIASVGQLFTTGDSHLGSVVRHLRKIFAEANARTPSILFFDEIDALPSRQTMDSHDSAWWSTVVTDFLTLLDGAVSDRVGVIVIAATNVVSAVDPALLRPGRLERKVYLGPPDANGLQDVLRHHLKGELKSVDLTGLCHEVAGITPADVMMAVRDARRIARRTGRPLEILDLRSVLCATEPMSPEIRWRIAAHEAGHAFIAHKVGRHVERIVVRQQRNSSGHTVSRQASNVAGTKRDFIDGLRILLAGRAAEEILVGAPSAGAGFSDESDLVRATQVALQLEMSSGLGTLAVVPITEVPKLAACSNVVRGRVEQLLAELYDDVRASLEAEKERLRDLALAVCERGEIEEQTIQLLLA